MVDAQHINNKKRTNKLKSLISPFLGIGTLGANRTRDTRIRNPVLYPLSYEGLLEQFQSGGIILKFF